MKSKLTFTLMAGLVAGIAGTALVTDAQAALCRGPKPDLCARSCWNARAPKCTISQMSSLQTAVIHHTASSGHYNTSSLATSKSNVRGVQNYHMDANGWCDIGYHFLVDKLGNIFAGRKGSADLDSKPRGAHDGCNSNSMGFTAMGYFHSPYNNAATDTIINKLRNVIAWRMPAGWDPTGSGQYYCGTYDKVVGHRQVSATACPGDNLHAKTKDGSGFENAIKTRKQNACN
jgi:hypothetical protein